MSGTESDILSNVPGLEDTSDGEQQSSSSTEQGGSSSEDGRQQSSERASEGGGENAAKPAHEQPPVVRRHDGLIERQDATDPRTRALVDPATGQVVAAGGIERRVYEKAQLAERNLAATRQQLQQAQTQLQAVQQIDTVGKQLNLQPEQQVMAMRVMADFMRDPVQTIEYLIGEVKAKGYTIPSLNGAGGQSDMKAFQRMLDERLGPLMQQQQAQARQTQAQVRAQNTLDTFLGTEPDARANLDILAYMIDQDQGLSLEGAYIRFMKWCMTEQLDPTQPVGPQVQAKRQQSQQPGTQPRQRPLPNGRQMNGNTTAVDSGRAFDENSEWSAIIKQSMTEAGMQM